MMSSRLQILMIAFLLALGGLFVVWYKVMYLGIPFTPHEKRSMFTVTAEIDLQGSGEPSTVLLRLPTEQPGMRVLSSEGEPGAFGMTTASLKQGEYLQWAKRSFKGKGKLFYKITVTPDAMYEPETQAKIDWAAPKGGDQTEL